ncbi:MAG: O-antigen ligase-related protein [Candidatus Yanofskybacteria bacterium GW2011_GWA1_48_10]|uniref:O-antigen ligase-related protein n=2 Tax=Candidatus Yanofskyibacteriota TaxID=1752733 RepID=A0A0G1X6L9_9BACT|nr:MAG: O-antigen ligase-related protein [Candidatus Yanofskybacteria bacterium GW2011_GWA1_48_10]OGN05978.1 MAG: hypothetical protein A2669_01260 [Candidatus Yanofskybacteria bacterium RIFCSPHIGHO2_01_FULL_48_25b]
MSRSFKRLENWLFYLFLFSIPISIRHIFGYEAFGFVEWTAVYVYATDILFAVLLGFCIFQLKTKNYKLKTSKADWFLLAFVLVAGISIRNAIDVKTAWFAWLKLLEGVALYFYVKDYALKRFDIANGFAAIAVAGLFQAIIAAIQFISQHSLGLKYFGESIVSPSLMGVASFFVSGEKIVRAYGTLPHPNILAAYLFVAIGCFYFIAVYHKREWWWHLIHAMLLWGFLLTFSRLIIALWVLNFLVRAYLIRFYPRFKIEFWDNPKIRERCLKIFGVTIAVVLYFVILYWPYVSNRINIAPSDEAVRLRIFYNQEVLKEGIKFSGVGIGNFVPWLRTQNLNLPSNLYQPVHNIYLLLYAEIGLIGVGLFVAFIISLLAGYYQRTKFRKLYHFSFCLIAVSLLIFGVFDHFLLTVQSGRLLFWLVLGLIAAAD